MLAKGSRTLAIALDPLSLSQRETARFASEWRTSVAACLGRQLAEEQTGGPSSFSLLKSLRLIWIAAQLGCSLLLSVYGPPSDGNFTSSSILAAERLTKRDLLLRAIAVGGPSESGHASLVATFRTAPPVLYTKNTSLLRRPVVASQERRLSYRGTRPRR